MLRPEVIEQTIHYHIEHYQGNLLSEGMQGAMVGLTEKIIRMKKLDVQMAKDVQTARRMIWAKVLWLDKPEVHSSELTDAQWYALYRWIRPEKVDGEWITRKDFPEELAHYCEKRFPAVQQYLTAMSMQQAYNLKF